jgi:hypothetical protein
MISRILQSGGAIAAIAAMVFGASLLCLSAGPMQDAGPAQYAGPPEYAGPAQDAGPPEDAGPTQTAAPTTVSAAPVSAPEDPGPPWG